MSTNASAAVIDQFDYAYDAAGNLSTETDTQGGTATTTTYSYDAANQVLSGGTASYAYDASGNRNTGGNAVGVDNQLTADGTWDYYYDAKGNLKEKDSTTLGSNEKWTYLYDNRNELIEAEHYNSSGTLVLTVDYKYDVFDNLIEEDSTVTGSSTVVTRYAVDGWNPALEGATGTSNFNTWAVLNGSNALETRNLFGDQVDQFIARVDTSLASDSAGTYWALTDHLGSVREIINNSGTVLDSITYDAYGNITSETNATYRGMYAWTGQQLDVETGLQYNRARWYDSFTGRWITQDPLGFDAGDSNLYRYVNNAPTDATDPSGRDVVWADRNNVNWYFQDINNKTIYGHGGEQNLGQLQGANFTVAPNWGYWIRDTAGHSIDYQSLVNYVNSRYNANGSYFQTSWWSEGVRYDTSNGGLAYGRNRDSAMERIACLLRSCVANGGKAPGVPNQAIPTPLNAFVEGLGAGASYAVGEGVRIAGNIVHSTMDSTQSFISDLAKSGQKILAFYDAVKNFGSAVPTVVTSAINNPGRFLTTIGTGLKSGFDKFTDGLLKNGVGRLLNWIAGTNIPNLPEKMSDIPQIALDFVGLSWSSILGQVAGQIGPRNLAAIDSVCGTVTTLLDSKQSITNQIINFANDKLQGFNIQNEMVGALEKQVTDAVPSVLAQVAKLLFPGAGQILGAAETIYNVANTFIAKAAQWTTEIDRLTQGALALANGKPDGLASAVNSALNTGLDIALNFIESLPPVNSVLTTFRGAVSKIKTTIPTSIAAALERVRDNFLGRLSLGKGSDTLLVAPVPNNTNTAQLAIFMSGSTPVIRANYNLRTPSWQTFVPGPNQAEQCSRAVALATEMERSAQAMANASSARGAATRSNEAKNLTTQANEEKKILQELCGTLAGCFAAGTKLLAPGGPRPIEDFAVGDAITSRNEFEPGGALEVKVVEALFRRTAAILHVHVGGKVIRTTSEHPFFVYNKNWVKASRLEPGDRLLGHDGQWVAVEEVLDTGEWEAVYNLRISDYHTYFVTDWNWGFSVWSHNANGGCFVDVTDKHISGPGGTFTVSAKVLRGTENDTNPKVYQVSSIEGPLKAEERDSNTAQEAMRDYLFGTNQQLRNANDAGHLIAASIGGPNTTWNLVPMARTFNRGGGWKSMERRIASFLGSSSFQQATEKVQVTYPASGSQQFMPNRVTVTLTFNGVAKTPIVFNNPITSRDTRNFRTEDYLATTWQGTTGGAND